MNAHDIIVIGASVGGRSALHRLPASFLEDSKAAVFITIHLFVGSMLLIRGPKENMQRLCIIA
jgi:chemotaxis response regulator CheB